MGGKILIVEDNYIEANFLQVILEKAGYEVIGIARSVVEALAILNKTKADLVFVDIFLKGKQTGIDLAKILQAEKTAFVYLSANSDAETLNAAKVTEPYGFLVKPFREKDLLVTIDIAFYLHKTRTEIIQKNTSLFQILGEGQTAKIRIPELDGIVGNSPLLLEVFEHLSSVANAPTSVLILGESGTGKEKIAESIHLLSGRKNKPLIKVNCAALPHSLIESELFGHERGSFTGAVDRRIGKFEQADGGTIFLDEIGEFPLDVQSKLLRVLQEREIERVGGSKTIPVNVRVISATNRNLEKEVAEGKFRIDLYYRLNVFPITLPPLRDRKEDIPLLSSYFLDHDNVILNKKIKHISPEIMMEMQQYNWPGNIRELKHFMERAALLTQGETIENKVLLDYFRKAELFEKTRSKDVKTMDDNERDNLLAALQKTQGRLAGEGGAADILGISVSTLNSRIKKLGIYLEKNFS
jgi:two-component system response regulator HydG